MYCNLLPILGFAAFRARARRTLPKQSRTNRRTPRDAFRTLRRIPLVRSRTASPRPLPSCRSPNAGPDGLRSTEADPHTSKLATASATRRCSADESVISRRRCRQSDTLSFHGLCSPSRYVREALDTRRARPPMPIRPKPNEARELRYEPEQTTASRHSLVQTEPGLGPDTVRPPESGRSAGRTRAVNREVTQTSQAEAWESSDRGRALLRARGGFPNRSNPCRSSPATRWWTPPGASPGVNESQ
jgi:hypothetical protein